MTTLYTATQNGPTHFQIHYAARPLLEITQPIDKESLSRLLAQCNEEALDPLHFPDVFDDYLWGLAHGYSR